VVVEADSQIPLLVVPVAVLVLGQVRQEILLPQIPLKVTPAVTGTVLGV